MLRSQASFSAAEEKADPGAGLKWGSSVGSYLDAFNHCGHAFERDAMRAAADRECVIVACVFKRSIGKRNPQVASILLCKIFEWVKEPLIIHTFEDGIKNSFTAGAGAKGTHFSDAPADLHKAPLDDISGTNTFPMFLGQ